LRLPCVSDVPFHADSLPCFQHPVALPFAALEVDKKRIFLDCVYLGMDI